MRNSGHSCILKILVLLLCTDAAAYTRQDTLRGSNGRGRNWWDVVKYELRITIDTATKAIRGTNRMTYRIIGTPDIMQIDLQEGINLISVSLNDHGFSKKREGNVYWISDVPKHAKLGEFYTLEMKFSGKPRQAVNPPWDGGFIWAKDSMGKPWISVACQGLGASSWWPCKDYQGDEPDSGIIFTIGGLTAGQKVANGNQAAKKQSFLTINTGNPKGEYEFYAQARSFERFTCNHPINTYNTTFYIGDYAQWHDTLQGEKGVLDLDFYPLRYNEAKAKAHWTQAKDMLRCFEYWMGPYPFYEDGYKLVEAPYLGMEHQSAIAYGNGYKNGYRSSIRHSKGDSSWLEPYHIDNSYTGVGFSFDYIIIHESAHEWFGNSITAQDPADNWLHEGLATYAEALFAEWIKGKDAAFAYTMGQWRNIRNDRPVIGDYGVNDDGSGDRYQKGSAVIHMIRMMLNDDKKFRELLRGLSKDFYHKTVTSGEVEDYISRFVGRDLKGFFDVYLRSTIKPVLEWSTDGGSIKWRWKNVPQEFSAPFMLNLNKKPELVNVASAVGMVHFDNYLRDVSVTACGWYDVVEKK